MYVLFVGFCFFFVPRYAFSFDDEQLAQIFLNRFTYGPRPGEARQLASAGRKGLQKWVEHQISRDLPEPEKLESALKKLKSVNWSNREIISSFAPKDYKTKIYDEFSPQADYAAKEMIMQKTLRAVYSENQFAEVILDFWFNHFNVDSDFADVRFLITTYERESIKPFIFGKFEDLLIAASKSPAMLRYFGQNNSSRDRVIENYSREVMELYTLGVGGGYNQSDVENAARIFTGWTLTGKRTFAAFDFNAEMHDQTEKTVLGLKFKNEGMAEGEAFLRHLAHLKQTAKFIARKLATRFYGDSPNQKDIDRIAEVFEKTGGDLKAVYRELMKPEALTEDSIGSKYKTPYHFVISAVRYLGGDVSPEISKMGVFESYLDVAKNKPYHCWPPPGYKTVADHWTSPGSLVLRLNFVQDLIAGKVPTFKVDGFNKVALPLAELKSDKLDRLKKLNSDWFENRLTTSRLEQIYSAAEVSGNNRDFIRMSAGYFLSEVEFQKF